MPVHFTSHAAPAIDQSVRSIIRRAVATGTYIYIRSFQSRSSPRIQPLVGGRPEQNVQGVLLCPIRSRRGFESEVLVLYHSLTKVYVIARAAVLFWNVFSLSPLAI